MGKVEVISKCLVGAAMVEGDPRISQIDLTPWDLKSLLVGYIQKGLIFHKPNNPQTLQQNMFVIPHLKASLSSALHFFPPLAGRLAVTKNDDGTTSVSINCNNEGVEFVVARASDVTVDQLLGPTNVPPLIRSFFLFNRACNYEGISKPLLGVHLTELADGYFISCSINHCAADASSFWHFFNSWSEISRGFRKLSLPPVLNPWFPENVAQPLHLPFDLEKEIISDAFTPLPFEERVFHLSKENIGLLKAKANSEMGVNSISSLQSYVAHLWRAITRSRCVNATEEVSIYVPIGARWRLNPPLPEGYWGNAIYSRVVRVKSGELLGRGLGWAAWEIHQVVAAQKHEEVVQFYNRWVRSPAAPQKKELFCANFLGIASSPRNDVYGVDFGWGKPVAARCGMDNKSDGKFSLFPGVEGDGSVDIEVCLLPQTLRALGNDREFIEFVTRWAKSYIYRIYEKSISLSLSYLTIYNAKRAL
ncbi:unnamed protein product [Cuscuta campestris]|uniref:Uncharacterized protein n=1 Tax=Cuscuta campestris TaxID=132261 RepID=A0A484M5I2_9ASTE|nr:unnamed protein product [Cuscuta campestris]